MNTDSKSLYNAATTVTAAATAVAAPNEPHFDVNSPSLIKQSIDAKWVLTLLKPELDKKSADVVAAVKKTIQAAFLEVAMFSTLEAYQTQRDLTSKFVNGVLSQIRTDLEKARATRCAADPSFTLKALPPMVVTGSVAHKTSYPPPAGDTDFASVCNSKEEMDAVLSLFLETYTIPNSKTGVPFAKAETVLSDAKFFMPSSFKTKLGLPWVPFNLNGMKFDQTFRMHQTHEVIESLAVEGYRIRFGGDKVKFFQYIQTQHALAIIKLNLADSGLRAMVEAIYAGNKIHLVQQEKKST